jgi:putative membrane protein
MGSREFTFWIAFTACAAIFTFVGAADRVNWLLDAGWVVAGLPLLVISRRWCILTPLAYRLLVLHAFVLMAGGYWTYEKMPLGLWAQEFFGASRNHYDRFGHFMQGFVPAILFRELFARATPVRGAWLAYFALTSVLAFSACFELLEWAATVLAGSEGGEFLGHQGDVWDAQWDMLLAIIGGTASLALLSSAHDRMLARLSGI